MKIFIDKIDVSELLLDIKYESDLSGSSRSSIFGSIETEQLELVVKNKHDGERLYIDDEEYAITECDYDEKSERTTVKAITDLRALDDEFELVGKEENVIEEHVSFKDFELTGNKPNLIPNGWDSFEPYGSGKNYVENWNFESDDLSEFIGSNAMEIKVSGSKLVGEVVEGKILQSSAIVITNIENLPLGKYLLRFKFRGNTEDTNILYRPRINNPDRTSKTFSFKKDESTVIEFEFSKTIEQDFDIYIYARANSNSIEVGDKIEIDWIQITPVDNQHLVVEKTLLGNGLTRIQTWGGNHHIKLARGSLESNVKKGDTQTRSLYVKNLGKGIVRFDQDGGIFDGNPRLNWDENKVGHKHFIGTFTTDRTKSNSYIRSDNDLPLDFIASDPQIVEGDVPNPVMTVDTLPDGKEEVNIYGANVNTELVYKADAVTGEPYELYGDIDNQGREIKLSSTLGDSDIKKGENQVNLKGDAKNREVAIKIGVA